MKKRSFFFKEYLTHFILIVVAFALAGSVFYHQMASYALRAKQTELKTTVQSLAEQSKVMQGTDSDVIRELYMLSIARIAKEDELTVLVTNESGEVQMAAHPNGSTYSVSGYRVPAEVVSELTRSGSYAAVGSVGVLTEATSYTVGSCVRDSDGNVCILRGPGNGRRCAAFDADARAHPARDARRDAHYLVHSVAAYHAPDQEYRGGGEGICLRQLRCARPRGQSLL